MKISIVIGTMNHLDDFLKPCIESIKAHTNLEDKEVIIVANGCVDNTKEYVESLGEPFKLVWFDNPLGFPRTYSEGIVASAGDYVILLNNDVVILSRSWIDLLLNPFTDQNVGLTGPLKFTFDCGGGVTREAFAFWCVMIKREVFQKIGYLDEIFHPFGSEDIDFSIRASNEGYELVQVPDNVSCRFLVEGPKGAPFPIWHKGSGTIDEHFNDREKKQLLENKNMRIICDRYGKRE